MIKIKIGDKVKDIVTGFGGTVTAEIKYMFGCHQYEVQPDIDENGNWVKGKWIDEPSLKKVGNGKKDKSPPKAGGVNRDKP